jgi:hypothetical protein
MRPSNVLEDETRCFTTDAELAAHLVRLSRAIDAGTYRGVGRFQVSAERLPGPTGADGEPTTIIATRTRMWIE